VARAVSRGHAGAGAIADKLISGDSGWANAGSAALHFLLSIPLFAAGALTLPNIILAPVQDPLSEATERALGGNSAAPSNEPCDGKDNDCDGQVDEAPDCGEQTGCSQSGCGTGLLCDARTDRCIAPRPVGADCGADAQCMDGFCVDPAAFGFSTLEGKRCASACCADADCATGNVCEVGSSGVIEG
jgi:hypothetical protein